MLPEKVAGSRAIADGAGSGYGDDPEQLAATGELPDSLPGVQGTCVPLNEMNPAILPQGVWRKASFFSGELTSI